MPRPLAGDDENAMQMIWHDHIFIKFYVDKMVGYSPPNLVTYLPWLIEAHSITAHLAEETASVGTAYRDKICAGGSVVVILQPGRFSFWQVVHGISGEACLAPTDRWEELASVCDGRYAWKVCSGAGNTFAFTSFT